MAPGDDDRWLDRDAGPIVRPYALTGGRTRPKGKTFDLMTMSPPFAAPEPTCMTSSPST